MRLTEASFKRTSPQRSADGYRALNEALVGSDLGSNLPSPAPLGWLLTTDNTA